MHKMFFLIVAMAGLSLISCKDDASADPVPNVNPGSMTVQINGANWNAIPSSLVCTFEKDPQLGDRLDIRGAATDGSHIILSTSGLQLKTYVFDTDKMVFDGLLTYIYKVDGKDETPFMVYAEIRITAHDAAAKTVSGTFSFRTDNDDFVGVNGSFSGMEYTEL